MEHTWVQLFVTMLIVVDGILIMLETDDHIHDVEWVTATFLIVFNTEIILKLAGQGCELYARDPYNLMDGVLPKVKRLASQSILQV